MFKKENRWGYFPSAAVAWRLSQENFLNDIDWIYNLKLRAGYGVTGNTAVPPYSVLKTLNYTENAYLWYVFDNENPVSGVIPDAFRDVNLQWERTAQSNLGVDFSVLGGKLSAVVEVYQKHATDVIIDKTIPNHTGKSAFTQNLATIDNKGVEIGLSWNILESGDFKWAADFNFSSNKNEVVDVGETDHIFIASEQALGIWNITGGNKFIVQEGESMGALFGLKAIGIWQESEAAEAVAYKSFPGEVKYEDLDNSGSIDANDRQIIGQTAPKFTYGIGTSFFYKNFDLAIQCIGVYGNDIYNFSRNILNREILAPEYKDRWSPGNTGSTQQVMPIGTDYSMTYVVSQYVEKGSFFKISNLSLGYTIPQQVLSSAKIGSLRVYGSADNLFTITKYTGLDPEASSTKLDSDSQSGIDAFSYPLMRTFSVGIKVTF